MTARQIDYESELNSAQYQAVTAGDGPVLVVAGAGSGKTRTLVYRVARLVEMGVSPRAILLLTFTPRDGDALDPANACFAVGGVPFAPKAAVLGINGAAGAPTSTDPNLNNGAEPTLWSAPIASSLSITAVTRTRNV